MDHIITSETSFFDPIVSYDTRPRRLIDTQTLEPKCFAKEEPIPPYAILSHLWVHGEEYEYQEFVELHDKADRVCQVLEFSGIELKLAVIEFLVEMRSKYGLKHGFRSAFQKIRAACQQALNDNFRYIWIDTCCIDKRNRDEVAQNIRSMYAYYQNAEVCYAYLLDVDMHGGLSFALPSSGKLEYAFEDSQWFRRGWTLQELLAPRQVIFFDKKWRRIGTRDEYEEMIVIETGIPWEVVSGKWPIQDVSPAVRMSWARGRETTVPQDQAYCLMGLLGVDMDPNYDEDVGESFRRLGKALIDAYPEHKGALYSPENPFRELMANSIPPDMTPLDIFPRRFINTFTLKLVQLEENSTPPSYAILSHRWMHEEEITFEEIQKDGEDTKSKFGYRKIQAACVQARRDGLCYLWVDTCCIQHGDQDDVKNNIRSMYAFYQNAEVCYAYLVDVYELSDFGNSEWFHRGWTLQELLAPRSLKFYDSGWNFIGSSVKLQKEIHAATGIPLKVLSGEVSIRDVDLEERMVWSIERETTKPQDQIYCLLGLLRITMDPDYNEDIRMAVERLKKLFEQVHPGYSFWRIMKNALRSATSFHLLAPLDIYPRRLIDTLSLELITFKEGDTIPGYAILSHRWIHDEEVTFQEFKNPSPETKSKSGYQKIESACQQAHDQGLCYIWIDTCCIDQKDHDDITWNLESMYAFYQNSQICYAYLVDFEQWYLDFSRSEWFQRGWTLQELLAPSKVVFFDKHWTRFGSRDENVDIISDVTRIPRAVLQGKQSLNDIHPLDRMSWAIGRKTTRPQDQIYCLFGLLGVSVESDYDQDIRVLVERLRKAFVQTYPKYSFWYVI
ncbi:hypothetical protein VKT23_009187 [Stygiomarasmius scandens]|uniref:Heterokaryon incompatibility domain-containing protein n=1 Tax=Marasmiellus scandens TaxID=2682957 RepID=A0ABR1JEP7_9AGAR